ncbi:BKACE family enzyme [Pseudooceanicola nitratireducens]|uniref:3-keto-5-aminohexanoate cleavage protein n=1 Tax=Pseudooceanicola nitratireducens TaxID=517719 RepID=UPI001C95CABE|nr:3-keto-5-aminohexanoate cleavage protein [Pseudooceanicola nitratireducens]MBY6156580.1 3-keto-5-aminohexanoate cleavage protein [Pseudooceanicola nitratireducens]
MLPHLMVAPTGARRQKSDHPTLPITLDEIVTEARACAEAGADGLHLHLRDAKGGHLLDAAGYRAALDRLRQDLPDMQVQITTEAVGIYDAATQRDIALNSGAALVSASVAELTRDGIDTARAFYQTCADRGIAIQHILYGLEDCDLLMQVLPRPLIEDPGLQLIFVLGRYAKDQNSSPADLDPFTDWLAGTGLTPDWMVCAFGPGETDCLVEAHRRGGKLRVGFENSLWHADGSLASSNADRVRALRAAIAAG